MSADRQHHYRKIRVLRIISGLVFLIGITLSFTIFRSIVVHHVGLTHFQFIPSFMAAAVTGGVLFIFFMLQVLLVGRCYCSWMCPLGVWQDIVAHFSHRKGNRAKRRYFWHRSYRSIGMIIAAIVMTLAVLGLVFPLAFIDPYSNWGRISMHVIAPVFTFLNNLAASVFPDSISYRHFAEFSLGLLILSVIFFVIVTVMSYLRGRLYCNVICPVGGILGSISRISLFAPVIDDSKCISCGLCEHHCKSECIDSKNRNVDVSRCVWCFDCMTQCQKDAISIKFRYRRKKNIAAGNKDEKKIEMKDRRGALITLGIISAMAVTRKFERKSRGAADTEIGGIIPPGGISIGHLKDKCTSCHACISACPSKIIRPARKEYGMDGVFMPVIHYDKSFCNYDCHACSDACPNDALVKITSIRKRVTQIGQVQFTAQNCVVTKQQTDCGACDEHCPTKAIKMVTLPGSEGLRYPQTDTELCIGCGACEYICPATPKAMKIIPLAVHGTAKMPEREIQKDVEVDDFGF